MFKTGLLFLFSFALTLLLTEGCLITNCPRGGKRSSNFALNDVGRQCASCGPGFTGQCFGPNICCGSFGCLMGTLETLRCKQESFFHDSRDSCVINATSCRKNTGRCAADNICCTLDGCFVDKECENEDKLRSSDTIPGLNLYNLFNKYHNELAGEK